MKKAIIILAILLFTGMAFADEGYILKGSKVEMWQVIRNGDDIQIITPDGSPSGFGQRNGDQTWIYMPAGNDRESSYTVIQHDRDD